MANDIVKSISLTNLDATPALFTGAGKGAPGRQVTAIDFCAATAAGLQSSGSYYKFVRLTTQAVISSVELGADAGPNISGSALAIGLGWAFSDSTDDGTSVALQGNIPTSANTGGTTTFASPSSPNQMYGIWKPAASAAIIEPTQFLLNGLGANYAVTGNGPGAGFLNQPLWQIFGFTDGRGEPSDPGGYLDLYAYVLTGATTGGACNLIAKVTYSI